jgi:hypothetical protein
LLDYPRQVDSLPESIRPFQWQRGAAVAQFTGEGVNPLMDDRGSI